MSIWHITDIEISDQFNLTFSSSAVRLWKVNEGEFLVIEQGDYQPVLSGALYTLVRMEFRSLLSGMADQVRFQPAKIIDRTKGAENLDYLSLTVFNNITPETIDSEPQDGRRIWTNQGELFVTDTLKHEMDRIYGPSLKFTAGFQYWGGPS